MLSEIVYHGYGTEWPPLLDCNIVVEVWACGAAREIPQNLNFFTKTNQILPNQMSALLYNSLRQH
jgi:hypothetical protein